VTEEDQAATEDQVVTEDQVATEDPVATTEVRMVAETINGIVIVYHQEVVADMMRTLELEVKIVTNVTRKAGDAPK